MYSDSSSSSSDEELFLVVAALEEEMSTRRVNPTNKKRKELEVLGTLVEEMPAKRACYIDTKRKEPEVLEAFEEEMPVKRAHYIDKKRKELGEFHTLFEDLLKDEKQFFIYFRMTIKKFDELLGLVGPVIKKQTTKFKEAISPKERLALTLRFLGHGDSFRILSLTYRMGETTVRKIIYEACHAIMETLVPIVMPKPTTEMWKEISQKILEQWNFPNALGSLVGKLIEYEIPGNTRARFCLYEKESTIVLLGLFDADLKFVCVEVADLSKESDSGVFTRSSIGKSLKKGTLNIPQPKPFPNSEEPPVPFVMVGDEGFPLLKNLMRPYSGEQLKNNPEKNAFNYRVNQLRWLSENGFEILVKKFRIYQRCLKMSPEHMEMVVKATTCLHNFLRNDENKMPEDILEDTPHTSVFRNLTNPGGRPGSEGLAVREQFTKFFNSPPQEENKIEVKKEPEN